MPSAGQGFTNNQTSVAVLPSYTSCARFLSWYSTQQLPLFAKHQGRLQGFLNVLLSPALQDAVSAREGVHDVLPLGPSPSPGFWVCFVFVCLFVSVTHCCTSTELPTQMFLTCALHPFWELNDTFTGVI